MYIVQAYRLGDLDAHSYVVGVFEKEHAAKEAAVKEEEYRGGKYSCKVFQTGLLKVWEPKPYFKEIDF